MQLIKVISSNCNKSDALLYCYENEKFKMGPFLVQVGENGLTLNKLEGDKKSPMGTYKLGPVFGDEEHKITAKKMSYLLITDELEGVDDPNSIYYNQLVYRNQIDLIDWKSSEKMKKFGDLYSLGVVIQYNQNPVIPFKGSQIFMHKLDKKNKGTLGCIGVGENNLKEIVNWLDADKSPHITIIEKLSSEN